MEPGFPFSLRRDAEPAPGLFRLILVHEGTARFGDGGRLTLLPAGTLLLIPPGSACRISPDPRCGIECLRFNRSLVDPLLLDGSVESAVELLAAAQPSHARLAGPEAAAARALYAAIRAEMSAARSGFQAMLRLKLMEAVLLLARMLGDRKAGTGGPLRFHVEEAQQYILARCTDQLSLTGIAARYGMNPSYFSRLFHHHAGVPLVEFINRARIQKSCQLLKRSQASIIDVALAVGYNNLSHFNRSFRRFMGMTPREYRISSRK